MNDSTTTTPLKQCSKKDECANPLGCWLPATTEYFHKRSPASGGGLEASCKSCHNKRVDEYRMKNREKSNAQARESMRRFRQTGTYNSPEAVDKRRQYRRENIEIIRERDRRRNKTARRKMWFKQRDQSEARQEYKYNHRHSEGYKEKARALVQRRRARRLSLPVDFPTWKWERCLEYWGYRCAVCGNQFHTLFGDLHVSADHWIPLASPDCPGTITTNMIPLCHGVGGCNNFKQDKDPKQWLIERYGKRKGIRILKKIEAYFQWVREQDGDE